MDKVYYEDIHLHQKYRSEGYLLTEEKMIEFSREWDPDGFHVDPEFAKTTSVGGLIAPAVLLMCIFTKLVREEYPPKSYTVGLGWDEVRFLIPARPGDVIYWEEEVISLRESNSNPTIGIVSVKQTLLNQRDEPVVTFKAMGMIERRPNS